MAGEFNWKLIWHGDQVVIAQLLARRLATVEVLGSNPGKGENLLISDKKGNLIPKLLPRHFPQLVPTFVHTKVM